MRAVYVNLNIAPEQFQLLYEGVVKSVDAYTLDGRKVRFPANILRPFVTHAGITGTFAIHFSDENRFLHIEKID